MTIQEYAKSRKLRVHQVKALIKHVIGEMPTSLSDEDINKLDESLKQSTQPQLPQAKEQLQLPQQKLHSDQIDEVIANDSALTHVEPSELAKTIQEQANQLTVADVQELQSQTQISEIQEQAVHHAVDAFQTYQDTYTEVTRSLILKDIYQRNSEREQRRKAFEEKQKIRQQSQIQTATSHDAKTEILTLMKADNYKSDYLNNILGGL